MQKNANNKSYEILRHIFSLTLNIFLKVRQHMQRQTKIIIFTVRYTLQ